MPPEGLGARNAVEDGGGVWSRDVAEMAALRARREFGAAVGNGQSSPERNERL